MLVITHKIQLQELRLTENLAGLSNGDAIQRWEFSLPLDFPKIKAGKSLTDSLKPLSYCYTGSDLHWSQIPMNTREQLDSNFWNRDRETVAVPFALNGFIPYQEITV